MKTPEYWQSDSFISKLLFPISAVYGFLTQLRLKIHKPSKAGVPVICVGNISAGGTGKTPVSLAIAKMLINDVYHPFFVTRGYGGKLKNVMVNNKKHTAKEVGDEPLLLSAVAPTVVNPNRFEGANLAIKEGADIIIMDDGFQNPSLNKKTLRSHGIIRGGSTKEGRRCDKGSRAQVDFVMPETRTRSHPL